jgi:hypothetical protein
VNADQKKGTRSTGSEREFLPEVALRCRLLLLAHQGVANQSIAQQLNVSQPAVLALRSSSTKDGWRPYRKFAGGNVRPRFLTPDVEQKILDTTLKTGLGDGSTHWSARMLAKHLRISALLCAAFGHRHDVQPH